MTSVTPVSDLIQSIMDAVPHPDSKWVKGDLDGSNGNWFHTVLLAQSECLPKVRPHVIWVDLSSLGGPATKLREVPFLITVIGNQGLRGLLREALLKQTDDSGELEGDNAIRITLKVPWSLVNWE